MLVTVDWICFLFAAPADYTAVSRILTLNAIISNTCVQIPIIDDNICEGNEEVLINLGTRDVNVIIAPNRSNGIIVINDNDGKL